MFGGTDLKILLSFDIDGTLEVGDPPGPVTLEMVIRAKERGFLVGSCSDRPLAVQKGIWESQGIEVDFAKVKPGLAQIKEQFQADDYYHIGDTELDRQFAVQAGFHFISADDAPQEPWLALIPEDR